jgi:hypothetical protein
MTPQSMVIGWRDASSFLAASTHAFTFGFGADAGSNNGRCICRRMSLLAAHTTEKLLIVAIGSSQIKTDRWLRADTTEADSPSSLRSNVCGCVTEIAERRYLKETDSAVTRSSPMD